MVLVKLRFHFQAIGSEKSCVTILCNLFLLLSYSITNTILACVLRKWQGKSINVNSQFNQITNVTGIAISI